MDQKMCWNCGNLIDARVPICPACNAPQQQTVQPAQPARKFNPLAIWSGLSSKAKLRICAAALLLLGVIFSSISRESFFATTGGSCVIGAVVLFVISFRQQRVVQQCRYVGCKSTGTFHRPSCKSVRLMDRTNRIDYDPSITYQYLISTGMKPCTRCKPRR